MCVLCCVVLLCVGLRCVALGCAGLCCVSCVVCVCVCVWRWGLGGLWPVYKLGGVVGGAWYVVRPSPSGVHPAAELWWHFAGGFDFGRGL